MGPSQNKSLRVIYSFVLALAFALFIGITIYTFYPFPTYPSYDYGDSCSTSYKYSNDYDYYDSASYKTCMNNQEASRKKQQEEYDKNSKNWFTIVSVILLTVSTLVIAGSIFLNEKLEIISNGLLLGSFFTLLASDGLSFGSGNKYITFTFSLIALAVTIATGYYKLVIKKKQQEGYQPVFTASMPPINEVMPPQSQVQPGASMGGFNTPTQQPSQLAPVESSPDTIPTVPEESLPVNTNPEEPQNPDNPIN